VETNLPTNGDNSLTDPNRAKLDKYLAGSRTRDDFTKYLKDTVEDELADAVIRIADLAGYLEINLEEHIKAKMKYNLDRPHKHGKRY